jgi:cytosine/uracil/thiamine/allantoin permease
MTTSVGQEEIQLPDGRVTLADPAQAGDPRLIPPLQPLYDYSWMVGLAVALILYAALSTVSPSGQLRHAAEPSARPA